MIRKLLLSGILLFIPLSISIAQNGTISGTVTDSQYDEALPGVNVFIPSLQRGASTNLDGEFTIENLQPGTYILQFSYIGYQNLQLQVETGTNDLVVNLERDFVGLDEVVVTGVGTETSKRKVAIDVASVSEEKLAKVPAYDVASALTGKVAGASIVNSGAPGGASVVTLRGINTLGNSRPMIMIDGVQVNADVLSSSGGDGTFSSNLDIVDRLADLDLSQIERVEVTKGAAASTLYGAQGANGVIQIFTKKGTSGRLDISLNSSVSIDLLNSNNLPEQPVDFHNLPVDDNGNVIGVNFDERNGIWTVPNEVNNGVRNKPYTGWVDGDTGEVIPFNVQENRIQNYYETVATNRHGLSISGGGDNTTFLISGNFLDQTGIEPETGFERASFRVNTDTEIYDKLNVSLRTAFSNSDRQGASESGDNIESGLNNLLLTKPFVDVFAENSLGIPPPKFQAGSVSTNPFFQKFLTDFSDKTNRFIGSSNINFRPSKFLEIDYTIGVDWYLRERERLQRNAQGYEDPNTSEEEVVILNDDGFFQRRSDTNWQFNSLANVFLRTDFREDFGIDFPLQTTTQASFDWRRSDFERTDAEGDGLPFGLGLGTIAAGNTEIADEFRSTFVTFGFLVNQKFDFDDYGGFSLGVRADKSSAFGRGADFEVFPRADAYIRISDFDFWNGLVDHFNEFKLRAAYGQAGIQPGPFDRFITLSADAIGNRSVFNSSSVLSNPSLGVEVSEEFEIGADFGFRIGDRWFQNLTLSTTYWNRTTDGSIEQLQVAPSRGALELLSNAIDLSSDGFDASINSLVYFSDQWDWLSTIQFATSETRVDNIANNEDLIFQPTNGFDYLFREGENFGVFYGRKPLESVDEIDPDTGERIIPEEQADNFVIIDGAVVNKFTKNIRFRNQKEIIGDPTPDFTVSWRNDFTIKGNWDISFQLDWVKGGDIFNATKWWMFQRNNHAEFQEEILIDGGEEVGGPMFDTFGEPTSAISRVDGSQPQAWENYHESKVNDATPFFVEDGTHLKLRELSVAYDFSSILGLEEIRRLRLAVTGRNLFTITDYSGFDPEVSGQGTDTRFRGLDIFTFPNFRNVTFTASVDF